MTSGSCRSRGAGAHVRRAGGRRLRHAIGAAMLVVAACAGDAAVAQGPPAPLLRVEAGMHTAPVRSVSADAAGTTLLTAADDKTLRLWAVPSGRLIKTLRPPVGTAAGGLLRAAALSPDGRTAAAAGDTFTPGSHDVYVFDVPSGRMTGRIPLPDGRLHRLAFSPDSRHLAGIGDRGLRVWRRQDLAVVATDPRYDKPGWALAFDGQGGVVTGAEDGALRRYDAAFKLQQKQPTKHGTQPDSVAFSPDGMRIAVGYHDTEVVDVFSAADLKHLHSPGVRSGAGRNEYSQVAWTSSGLYAGGVWDSRRFAIARSSDTSGRDLAYSTGVAQNTVLSLAPLKNGGVAFATADPSVGVLDAQMKPVFTNVSAAEDFREVGIMPTLNFRASQDGKTVSFDSGGSRLPFFFMSISPEGRTQTQHEPSGKKVAVFSLVRRTLTTGAGGHENLLVSGNTAPGLEVTDWQGPPHAGSSPKLNGRPIPLDQGETPRSLAVSPDEKSFALGTDRWLRLYDRGGRLKWRVSAPNTVWQVLLQPGNRLVIAYVADGTVRWYRAQDGRELLALFPHSDGKQWAAWTPSGYFMASAGGDALVGWHVNNGRDQAADFYAVARFRDTYYRPDVVQRVLETLDESEAVRLAGEAGGARPPRLQVGDRRPPSVQILSPVEGEAVSSDRLTVSYEVRSASTEPVIGLNVLLDGRPAEGARGLKRVEESAGVRKVEIAIPPRDVEITLVAENRHGAGEPATVRIRWRGAKASAVGAKPRVKILAVGVSVYAEASLRLRYAAKDAQDFVAAVSRQQGRLYSDVTAKVLTDGQATRGAVLDGLEWLRQGTKDGDVAMLFLAGHGVNSSTGTYYFLPTDADPARLKSSAVAYTDIRETVTRIAGRALFFVDTCHSGNVLGARPGLADIDEVANDLSSPENGVVVYAASTGAQASQEGSQWANGAFTRALVEGLSGKADYTKDGRISIVELDLYLSERVKEMTRQQQTPSTAKPRTVPDFTLALVV